VTFTAQNVQAFLIGHLSLWPPQTHGTNNTNIIGASGGFQAFLISGLTRAVITTVLGSLAWHIIALSFPVADACLTSNTVNYCSNRNP
jgi:hypothetical protein